MSLKEKKEGEQGNKEPADTTDSPGSDHNTKSRDRREAYVTLARPGTSRDRRAKNENAAFNDHFYYQHDPPPVAHGVNWVPLTMIGGVTATSSQPYIFNYLLSHPKSALAVQTFASEQPRHCPPQRAGSTSVYPKGLISPDNYTSSNKTRSNQEGFSVTLLGGKGLKEPHDFSLLQRLLQLSTFPSSSSSHELSESPQDLDQTGESITLHRIDPDFP